MLSLLVVAAVEYPRRESCSWRVLANESYYYRDLPPRHLRNNKINRCRPCTPEYARFAGASDTFCVPLKKSPHCPASTQHSSKTIRFELCFIMAWTRIIVIINIWYCPSRVGLDVTAHWSHPYLCISFRRPSNHQHLTIFHTTGVSIVRLHQSWACSCFVPAINTLRTTATRRYTY